VAAGTALGIIFTTMMLTTLRLPVLAVIVGKI
jgi:hypothetical protein